MGLQGYYDNYCRPAVWADPEAERCGCRGSGWWLSELDTFHECPHHHRGQPHPEDEAVDAWVGPVEAPSRDVVGERFGVPVFAPDEDDDIPF